MQPKNNSTKFILLILIILTTLTLTLYTRPQLTKTQPTPTTPPTRIIDGDTFELSTGEKVRLICKDTPEVNEKGYEEAKEFLSNLILNKEIRLEKDISETDKYNRLLRYAFISNPEDSTSEIFINKELVSQGYAEIMRIKPDVSRCGEIANL